MKKLYVDVETTGLDPKNHSIHQLCTILVEDGKTIETLDLKFSPSTKKLIDLRALKISGLTEEDVQSRDMTYEQAFMEFMKLLVRHCKPFDAQDKMFFCAYNAHFDKDFIVNFIQENQNMLTEKLANQKFLFGNFFWSNTMDIMVLASYAMASIRTKMNNFKLTTVYNTLRMMGLIDTDISKADAHDALFDVYMTMDIEKACVKLMQV
ncbi:MAG TPA: 3'-5' exonuclease [Saccharofermentans sp.]|nr:3'-5' exonuclease [Saccharofermentans sp.]